MRDFRLRYYEDRIEILVIGITSVQNYLTHQGYVVEYQDVER